MRDISGDVPEPLDDGVGLLQFVELSLDVLKLEAMLFLDDGNWVDENINLVLDNSRQLNRANTSFK